MRYIKILTTILLLLILATSAWAATTPAQEPVKAIQRDATREIASPEPPSSLSVAKANDLSASLLSAIFGGDTWAQTGGGAAVDDLGGTGRYAGLIVTILGTFNLLAMAFVSISVLYQWGIFAVATAHEGKSIGGSVYNSL